MGGLGCVAMAVDGVQFVAVSLKLAGLRCTPAIRERPELRQLRHPRVLRECRFRTVVGPTNIGCWP